jgi:hypothetical protein
MVFLLKKKSVDLFVHTVKMDNVYPLYYFINYSFSKFWYHRLGASINMLYSTLYVIHIE